MEGPGDFTLNQDVIDRQIETIQREGLAGMLAMSPENFAYLAGFPVPSQEPLRWRHAAVVIAADGATAVMCVDIEETTVRAKLPHANVYVWQEFQYNAVDVLTTMLQELGITKGRLGVETDYVPAKDFAALDEALSQVTLVPCEQLLARSRMIKTPREVELIRDLSQRTDTALAHAFSAVGPGSTELELAGAAVSGLFANGIDRERGMVTASGDRSQYPNVRASGRKMTEGDVVRLEIFGVSQGYHAGICRSGVVGQLPAEPARVWDVLVACRRVVLEALRPGTAASAVYRSYLERFAELGYEPISFVGHGIGVYLHEEPYLGLNDDTVIEAGMVFGIEPLLYLPGHFGLQIKDTVHVTPDGAEVLSDVMDAEQLAVIA